MKMKQMQTDYDNERIRSKRMQAECANGRLPAMAPLANPYVPYQYENPPQYEARRGIIRGTMFPGLDLSFQGKVNNKELNVTPLTQLQVLNFAIQDLALYLDTHRDDQEALETYRAYQKMYQKCQAQYQKEYGPLTNMSPEGGEEFRWLDDPWPWEYCRNKGV